MLLHDPQFLATVGKVLYVLKKNGELCDLYLKCCDDQTVSMHTCVAAAASPMIHSILKGVLAGTSGDPAAVAIPVNGVTAYVMEDLAHFMYTGCVNITTQEHLQMLLEAANYFEVTELSTLIQKELLTGGANHLPSYQTEENEIVNKETVGDSKSNSEESNLITVKIDEAEDSPISSQNVEVEEVPSEITTEVIKVKDEISQRPTSRTIDVDESSSAPASQQSIPSEDIETGMKSPEDSRQSFSHQADTEESHPSDEKNDNTMEDTSRYQDEMVDQDATEAESMTVILEVNEEQSDDVNEDIPIENTQDSTASFDTRNEGNSAINTDEIPGAPVKWTERIRKSEKSKILDLIRKKKPKIANEEDHISVNQSISASYTERVVTQKQEDEACSSGLYRCLYCERQFMRKFYWVVHLNRSHNYEVESVTSKIQEKEESGQGEPTISSEVLKLLDSEENPDQARHQPRDPTREEQEALEQMVRARRILQKFKPNFHGGLSKKQRVDKTCPLCGEFFKYNTFYDEHVKKHTDPKPYKCTICHKAYATKHTYTEHVRQHTEEQLKYKCPECPRSFSSNKMLQRHAENQHPSKPLKCQYCSKQLKNELTLKVHTRQMHGHHQFTCNECGKSMALRRKEQHMNLHHKKKSFACNECTAVFLQQASLDHHKRTRHNANPDLHVCPLCEQNFCTKETLKKHMIRHTDMKNFTCTHCARQFYTKGELDQHEAYHRSNDNRPHQCEICKKSFAREYSLRSHMLTHMNEKPFGCEHCGKRFRWKNKLKEHVRVHTGEKPYKCRKCDSWFTDCALRRHHEKKMHVDDTLPNNQASLNNVTQHNYMPGGGGDVIASYVAGPHVMTSQYGSASDVHVEEVNAQVLVSQLFDKISKGTDEGQGTQVFPHGYTAIEVSSEKYKSIKLEKDNYLDLNDPSSTLGEAHDSEEQFIILDTQGQPGMVTSMDTQSFDNTIKVTEDLSQYSVIIDSTSVSSSDALGTSSTHDSIHVPSEDGTSLFREDGQRVLINYVPSM